MAETHSPATHTHDEHAGHPGWRTYVVIGVILTVITAVEVAIFYIESLAGVLVPSRLILSALKFVIVVAFYMHLKFDDAIFRRVFLAPLFLGALVVIGMVILFKVLPGIELG